MGELEELPSWAGRSTGEHQLADIQPQGAVPPEGDLTAPNPNHVLSAGSQTAPTNQQVQAQPAAAGQPVLSPQHTGRRPWRMALLAFLGLFALFGIGAAGYLLANFQSSESTEAAATTETEDVDNEGQLGSQVAAEPTEETEAAETTEVETDESTEITVEAEVEEPPAAAETEEEAEPAPEEEPATTTETVDSGREAVFRDGKLYLSGSIPSEEIGQAIAERAAAVVGPDNVITEYEIDPNTVIEAGASTPLLIDDVVLFEFNSVTIASPFLPILDLGTLLLSQNPQATVTVVTRTDAVGSAAVNLEVATRRAQAVVNYWVGQGVNPDQIDIDPRGEEGASEDDDEQTAALNRRAEFIITGLLDG